MFDLVFHYCSNPISDAQKLLNMIIFNYFIGNTDGHIKNFSLLYDENLDHIRLAPAYDIVSRYCYDVPGESIEDAQFAISISGEKSISKICKNSFLNTADDIRINKNIIEKCYTTIEKNFKNALIMSADELYNEGFSNVKHLSQKILKHINV